MNSHLLNITRTIWALGLMLLFVSCQDTIPKRSLITGASTDDTPVCTEGQELVSETVDGVTTQVCKDKAITRPDGAITWKADFCACKDTKPVSYGNCSVICADKATNGAEVLYANFTVSDDIALNSSLKTVYGWCKNVLTTTDTANPSCKLQAKDEAGNVTSVDVVVGANSNSLTANIQDKLSYDKTYVITLVEETSGAKSNSVNIIKFSSDTMLSTLGPIKKSLITQYSCLVRALEDDNFNSSYRLHFYFVPRLPPDPVAAGGNGQLICHNTALNGTADAANFPRLEEIAGIFNLWDTTDPRYYDNNNNGALDINEAIIQKTKNFGATIPASSSFFIPFKWPGPPTLSTEAGNDTTTEPMGYYMAPWIDQTTFKSYCLTSTHYNSTNALYKAFRDYIGVDTEGLYVGVKAAETITNSDGTTTAGLKDYLLIRETDLKAVWFYLKSGVPTVPTDDNVANNAVFFYYPLNTASPYIQSSTQRLYKVTSAAELSTSSTTTTSGSTSTGTRTSYPPHDRKIGCVPKF
jgi:hypothetical protein